MINESLVSFSTYFLNYSNLQVIVMQLLPYYVVPKAPNDLPRSRFTSGYNYWKISPTDIVQKRVFYQQACILSVHKYGRMPDDTCINMLCFQNEPNRTFHRFHHSSQDLQVQFWRNIITSAFFLQPISRTGKTISEHWFATIIHEIYR